MKSKRMIAALLAMMLSVTAMTACGGSDSSNGTSANNSTVQSADESDAQSADESDAKNEQTGDSDMEGLTAINDSTAKRVGRTYIGDDNTLWLALSGSGAEFTYTGKKLELTIKGDNVAKSGNDGNNARVAVYVNGERTSDVMIDAPEVKITAFESAEAQTVDIQVIKLSECAMSCCGIMPVKLGDGESLTPVEAKERKIEFIGDSITCGYGVDDEVKEHSFQTKTEDVTRAYAYKTAKALDADYSMFSVSGYGIISGYTTGKEPVTAQTIPQYYNSLGFSYGSFDGKTPQSLDWDFESFKPQVVVINLGTNDASYTKSNKDGKEEYKQGYIDFLKQVREKNPDAEIFCTLGIMDNTLVKTMAEAMKAYMDETGDQKVHAVQYDLQDGNADGYAADWHPTEATHEKASAKLTEEIKRVMNW